MSFTLLTTFLLLISGFAVYGVYRVFNVGMGQSEFVQSLFVRFVLTVFMGFGLAAIVLSTLVGTTRLLALFDPVAYASPGTFMFVVINWGVTVLLAFGWANFKNRQDIKAAEDRGDPIGAPIMPTSREEKLEPSSA